MTAHDEQKILYLVIPCFNEESVLPETAAELESVMNQMIYDGLIASDSRIIFVDDGSRDRTWSLIERYSETDALFGGIALGRNVGHQNALLAGLMTVKDCCHMTISMDADLQDSPALLPDMVKQYLEGCEIVYTVRNNRSCDSFFKKTSASLFYRFMELLGADISDHGADFRLLSAAALDELSNFREHDLFLRGLIPMLGLPSVCLSFERKPRRCGDSKYSFRRMMALAADGVFSLSRRPLDLILFSGLLCLIPSLFWLLFHLTAAATFKTIIASIWAVGGLLLIAVGIVGQYIGRIYQEALGRPRYKIRETKNLITLEKK